MIGKRFRHYKGKEYTIIAIAKDSENLEEMVVYQGHYCCDELGDKPVFVRSAKAFFEIVEKDGSIFHRFEEIN